jgi:ribosomal protein S18 acetylase RimI-like enzyme
MKIVPFTEDLIAKVTAFTDLNIGKNYYTLAEMQLNQKKSIAKKNGEITSFVLLDDEQNIAGLRLAYPPGNWAHGKGSNLNPELWPFKLSEAAYFQSLFVSTEAQGLGFGPQLSEQAIKIFIQLGARGIVTHCWKESPNNSSFKYLEKMNFNVIKEHPDYWIDVDYVCTRDGSPCHCTALEMVKVLA